jgi:hypothetical protein
LTDRLLIYSLRDFPQESWWLLPLGSRRTLGCQRKISGIANGGVRTGELKSTGGLSRTPNGAPAESSVNDGGAKGALSTYQSLIKGALVSNTTKYPKCRKT